MMPAKSMSITTKDGSDMQDQSPETVFKSKYKLLGSVGVGCAAQVFDAICLEETKDDNRYVVKVANLTEEAHVRAFRNERTVLGTLPQNPYCVRMVESFEGEFKGWLVMERAGDLTLERFVKQNKQSVELDQIREISRQLLEAVDFLHRQSIVHRDIKPDNVMLTLKPYFSVKLIDFNIAHDLSLSPEIRGANGLREWSAPETRKFSSYDQRCDLWSVGCILHYLCTSRAPVTDN